MNLSRRWDHFWFAPQGPLNLAVCRIAFFGLMCAYYLAAPLAPLSEVNETSAVWHPVWLLEKVERVARRAHVSVVAPPTAMQCIVLAWKVSLVLACIGLLTRFSTAVAFFLGLYLIALANSYGKFESNDLPPIFIMGILALSRCGDALSLDAPLRRARHGAAHVPVASGEYRWPARAVWAFMAVMFFDAGLAKLRQAGLHWALGNSFSLLLIRYYYDPNPPMTRLGLMIAHYPLLARLFALGSLFIETCFPLALFNRHARRFFPPAAFAMQFGIGLIMNIWFLHYMSAYLFWVPWDRLAARVAPRWARAHGGFHIMERPDRGALVDA